MFRKHTVAEGTAWYVVGCDVRIECITPGRGFMREGGERSGTIIFIFIPKAIYEVSIILTNGARRARHASAQTEDGGDLTTGTI
jgi:hypothetical protein